MTIRTIAFLFLLVIANSRVIAQRNCGSVYSQAYVNSLSPSVKMKLENFNKQLKEEEQKTNLNKASATSSINENDYILIPVVVHVVWNNANQNLTDAQICSQISVLNQDFNRSNLDAANTPQEFQFAASNSRIQFYLATIDPNGQSDQWNFSDKHSDYFF